MIGMQIAGGILASEQLRCPLPHRSHRLKPSPPSAPAARSECARQDGSPRRSATCRPVHAAAPHRHGEAFVYAYVLEGPVRSQLDDTPVSTYHPVENWVEQPG